MAFVAAAFNAMAEKQQAASMRAIQPQEPTSKTTGSSRNGGHRGSNMAVRRAAVKKRNQARHRAACRC